MKEKILLCAKELFGQHGVKKITMDDIAQKLSISKKTLYENFNNKEEIADAVVEKLFADSETAIEEICKTNSNPYDQIELVGKLMCKVISNTNPLFLEEIRKYFTKSYKKFQYNLYEGLLKSVAKILDKGKEEKVFRPGFNSFLMSVYLLELFRTGLRKEEFNSQKSSIEIMFQLYLRGISNRN